MIEPVRLTSAEAVALWGELNPGLPDFDSSKPAMLFGRPVKIVAVPWKTEPPHKEGIVLAAP